MEEKEKFNGIDYTSLDKMSAHVMVALYDDDQLRHIAKLLEIEVDGDSYKIACAIKKALYYCYDNIDAEQGDIRIIIGERSNGKTYGFVKKAIECYLKTRMQSAYVRHTDRDFSKKVCEAMAMAHVSNGLLVGSGWDNVHYRAGGWYLTKWDEDLAKDVYDATPFMLAYSLSTSITHEKGARNPNIRLVAFDEFMTRRAPAAGEFVDWNNLLSTLVGNRDNVIVYMLANTVNKYSHWFEDYGLRHVKHMQQGTIDSYDYEWENDLTHQKMRRRISVEYCKTSAFGKASDKYFAFDNPQLKMITNGCWEFALYPHWPDRSKYPYDERNIRLSYYIIYEGEMLQADVHYMGNVSFTYIHRKTTPIKDDDRDLIFSDQSDPRKNWRRFITSPIDKKGDKLLSFYKEDKVYYQDNEIGEIVRSYLQWCKTHAIIKA